CGFCKYWITHWKTKTQDRINYKTYQEAAQIFADIPLKEFKKASRLIAPDGSVFSGPDSAFKSFTYFENSDFRWHRWYSKYKWFRFITDHIYNFIAKHRGFMLVLTRFSFGKNPEATKPYWLIILIFVFFIIYVLLQYL